MFEVIYKKIYCDGDVDCRLFEVDDYVFARDLYNAILDNCSDDFDCNYYFVMLNKNHVTIYSDISDPDDYDMSSDDDFIEFYHPLKEVK